MSAPDPVPEGVTPDGARYAAHLIRKRSRGDRFHPRRPETAAAMLAAAEWLDQFATRAAGPPRPPAPAPLRSPAHPGTRPGDLR